MATSRKANRTTLVDGCGTILKTKRLEGGYKLVKRKRAIGSTTATASAPKRKAGRPAKAKMVATITEKVVMTAPKRKAGRPAKAKMVMTAPKRKAGRPAKAKMVMASAPKRKAGRPAKAKMVATITEKVVMTAPKRKAGRPAKMRMATAPVRATAKRRGKRKSVKA